MALAYTPSLLFQAWRPTNVSQTVTPPSRSVANLTGSHVPTTIVKSPYVSLRLQQMSLCGTECPYSSLIHLNNLHFENNFSCKLNSLSFITIPVTIPV